MLEESTISLRLQFNERFLALRYLKRQLIKSVNSDATRIQEINAIIGMEECVWTPTLDSSEYPDDRDEIEETELQAFIKMREKTPWLKAIALPNVTTTGLKTEVRIDLDTGAYNVMKNAVSMTNIDVHAPKGNLNNQSAISSAVSSENEVDVNANQQRLLSTFYTSNPEECDILSTLEASLPSLRAAKLGLQRAAVVTGESTVEREMRAKETCARFILEKNTLRSRTKENLETFAEAIEQLRRDRHVTVTRLVLAEIRTLVLLQEFQLLQTFEDKDNALHQKQLKCIREERYRS